MSDTKQIAQKFLDALASHDAGKYEDVLAEDVGLRVARWDGGEVYRPRARVIKRLMDEWSAWCDATLETFTVLGDDGHAAVEFRIQATEQQRYVEHNRCAFLTIQDGHIQVIDLYCPAPLPSARRKGWIAPTTLTEDELKHLFDTNRHSFDVREWVPLNANWCENLSISFGGLGGTHPGANEVEGAWWTPEEADAKIEEMLAYYRERNQGFHWEVSTFDTPLDLGERLERHGFVPAGYSSTMARIGLDNLEDIPANPNVEMELVDGSRDESIEEAIRIVAISFTIPQEQIDQWRPVWYERMKDPKARQEELFFMARLDGKPVGTGRITFKAGTAHLTSGATLPGYRRRHIYSTMLRRRLEQARARGYHIVTIDAGPMSRRVVERYGFKQYAGLYIYGWMPVIDLEAIRSLVPND
jgi:ketosteroid isomerase-like protein/GNAT superfamily N-acetyltransferase